jgi:hypothetical protein
MSLLAGLSGTIIFTLLLTLAPEAGSPPMNVALWDGSMMTLNLRLATALGYILEVTAGTLLAYGYQTQLQGRFRGSPWIKGAALGAGLWVVVMIIGLPLFDLLSPLVNNGLMLAPGVFAWNLGAARAFFLLF